MFIIKISVAITQSPCVFIEICLLSVLVNLRLFSPLGSLRNPIENIFLQRKQFVRYSTGNEFHCLIGIGGPQSCKKSLVINIFKLLMTRWTDIDEIFRIVRSAMPSRKNVMSFKQLSMIVTAKIASFAISLWVLP